SDTLIRLIYHKYLECYKELQEEGKDAKSPLLNNNYEDKMTLMTFIKKVKGHLGLGGFLPLIVLFGVIFNALDIAVLVCVINYCFSFLILTLYYFYKAIKFTRKNG
ncbi:MAG: hypothetical protein ACI4QE_03845, partial [Acutalibacteraceae bacterium]